MTGLALMGLASLGLPGLGAGPAHAQIRTAHVLTDAGVLLTVDTANPGTPLALVPVVGVTAGEGLIGIDVRPMNGLLYGVGVNAAADTLSLYLISPRTGQATVVGAGNVGGVGDLPEPLAARYGIDFNPAVDRLRVTTSTSGAGPGTPGLNFRLDPNTGDLVAADTAINPGPISIDEIAYTNNTRTATDTTLYTISSAQNALYIQNPVNGGTQTAAVGLGTTVLAVHGFDLDASVTTSGSGNAATSGSAFAVVTTGAGTGIVTINLVTGAVSPFTPLEGGATAVRGFAVNEIGVSGSYPAFALTSNGLGILRFDTLTPATAVSSTISPAGIVAGDTLVALDLRPQTGQLLALGFNAVANSIQLYLIDPLSAPGAASATAVGTPTLLSMPGATAFGFDFDATVDRIRVVSNVGENFRINPNSGVVILPLDAAVNPAGRVVHGVASTNSVAQPLTGGVTTLYTLDATNRFLSIQNPPNGGTQTGDLWIADNASGLNLAFTSVAGFDLPSNVVVSTPGTVAAGAGYALLTVGGTTSLYTIDLTTGRATIVGGPVGGAGGSMDGLALGEAPAVPTVTTLTPVTTPVQYAQQVTLTATVSPATATGTVVFTDGGVGLRSCPVVNGVATCQGTLGNPGTRTIGAMFLSSDGTYLPSIAPTTSTVEVTKRVVTIAMQSVIPAQVGRGGSVAFTAAFEPEVDGFTTFIVDGVDVGSNVTSDGHTVWFVFDTEGLDQGPHTVTARYNGTTLNASSTTTNSLTFIIGQFTQHFAEGSTGFFQTDIGIVNPSDTFTSVTLRLLPQGGAPSSRTYTLYSRERRSFDVNALLAEQGFSGAVSAVVESDQLIGATRQMTWGSPAYGSTLESGIPAASQTWYFAEGATSFFSLFYLVQNPGAAPATVTFTHLLEGGAAPVVHTETLEPFSRSTFFINDVPGIGGSSNLSTVITATQPVVAERAMYLNTSDRLWEGATVTAGATSLNTNWAFAEGASGFFFPYLLLGNPSANDATVTVVYNLAGGATITKTYPVAAQSRRTVDIRFEDAQLASGTFGMRVTSTQPIVAERVMWWGLPFTDGSVTLGTTVTGFTWAIGEGREGGVRDEATFVLVSNTENQRGQVRFSVVYDDGNVQTRDYDLEPLGRLTIRIRDDFPYSAFIEKFSVIVQSVQRNPWSGVPPITVEYARYTGNLDAGGAALATRIW